MDFSVLLVVVTFVLLRRIDRDDAAVDVTSIGCVALVGRRGPINLHETAVFVDARRRPAAHVEAIAARIASAVSDFR